MVEPARQQQPSSPLQELSGFWGVPTATIDWCEDNYETSPYFAEFWNTISNAGMIMLALYGIVASVRRNELGKSRK